METLKEIRVRLGLKQAEVSLRTSINIPVLSNYELGNVVPTLEDCVILENQLGGRIYWGEELQTLQRRQIIQNLISLMEKYPLTSVLSFGVRAIREDNKHGNPPGTLIALYSKTNEQEPLGPGGCEGCE